jgi:hypothetical protein
MSAAPAFELTLSGSASERSLIALLGALTGAAVAAWLWSHAEARQILRGHAVWTALLVVGSAGIGAWIGWFVALPRRCTLRWHSDRWTWIDAQSNVECVGTVEPRLDLGHWMLLALRSPDGALRWATIGRERAGAAWHPLRSTLFAPARRPLEPRAGNGAQR